MLRSYKDLAWTSRMAVRGGAGRAEGADYLKPGDMEGVEAAGRTMLEPGSSIGAHLHADTSELYLILEGHGTGILDGERFPVVAGDLFLCRAGHAHGLENDSQEILSFLGVLTRKGPCVN